MPALKLDLGCGPRKRDGHIGVDIKPFPGVDVIADLRMKWPWKDGEVHEVYCSHFVEHLTAAERVHFVNELYRVLKNDGQAVIITPHWAHSAAYGDLTHQWPPVVEWWYSYLRKSWREEFAPHDDHYTCDFTGTIGYALDDKLKSKSPPPDEAMLMVRHYRDTVFEMIATLRKAKS
jgi:SAM-dependent methyltransferase